MVCGGRPGGRGVEPVRLARSSAAARARARRGAREPRLGDVVVVAGAHELESSRAAVPLPRLGARARRLLRCGLAALPAAPRRRWSCSRTGRSSRPEAIDRVIGAGATGARRRRRELRRQPRRIPSCSPATPGPSSRTRAPARSSAVLVPCDDLGPPGDVDVPADLPKGLHGTAPNSEAVELAGPLAAAAGAPSPLTTLRLQPQADRRGGREARGDSRPSRSSWLEEGRSTASAGRTTRCSRCVRYATALGGRRTRGARLPGRRPSRSATADARFAAPGWRP